MDKSCSGYLLFRVSKFMVWMCFMVPPAVNSVCISAELSQVFTKGECRVSICINFTGMSGPHTST